MNRFRGLVADFGTTDDPLTRGEVEAARVLLRRDGGGPLHEVRPAGPGRREPSSEETVRPLRGPRIDEVVEV
ncbi:hypothetical protein GCM10027160_42280 [Streptomyces calidiresistens]